jgi:hypothetical protein
MSQYQNIQSGIIKYLIIIVIIFSLLIVIPEARLSIKDTLVMSTLLTVTVFIVVQLSDMMTSPEHFDDISPHSIANKEIQNTKLQPQNNQPAQDNQKVKIPHAIPPVQLPQQPQIQTDTASLSEQITKLAKQVEQLKANQQYSRQTKDLVVPTAPADGPQLYKGGPHAEDKEANGNRANDDVIISDVPYTDYNHLPLGDTYDPKNFDYGYSFLPPEKWYPTPPFPPVCVSEKRCPVCPTNSYEPVIDLKEWKESTRITPPYGINTKYVKDVLNSGR